MQLVPIQAVPNQSFSVTLDGNNYVLGIKYTNGCMSVSVVRNTVQIIENMRVVAGQLVIPFRYLESGNFFFTTANQQLPNYEQFNITQQLIYLSASELAQSRTDFATNNIIVTESSFDALGDLPLRFKPQGYLSPLSAAGTATGSASVSGIGVALVAPVYFVDAGLSASYAGTGQTFANALGNTDYDFWLGNNNASANNDPTFNGVAGSNTNAEYFSGDGGDYFTIKSNSTFINSLHKENAVFTWYGFIKMPTGAVNGMLCGDTGSSAGLVGIYLNLAAGRLQFGVADGTNNIIVGQSGAGLLSSAESCLVAFSYDESTGVGLIYKKTAAGVKTTSTFTRTYNAAGLTPSSSSATTDMSMWHRGGVGDVLGAGCQLWQSGMYAQALSESQLDDLWTLYHTTKLN